MVSARGLCAALTAWALTLVPAIASADCRQALVLGLDVSGSVDLREYWLQRNGLASALEDPEVVAAFLAIPDAPVSVMVFEWSGAYYQRELYPWVSVISPNDLSEIANQLRTDKNVGGKNSTAIGAAILFAGNAFERVAGCWKRTLDLSGDGKNNDGPGPETMANDPSLHNLTINGLVVIGYTGASSVLPKVDIAELVAYFQRNVIRGPGAFTEVTLGFEDFEHAMKKKLLREISVPAFSHLATGSK